MKFFSLRLPLAYKVFLLMAAVGVLISAPSSWILYHGASLALRHEARERLKKVAQTASIQIDPELHSRITNRSDENTEAYRKIKAQLIAFRNANPGIRYVYTMRKTDNPNELQFVADAEEDPKLVSRPGDPYDTTETPEMRRAFGGPAADLEPTRDKWGCWLSGYAPIKNKSGGSDAILGMDMSLKRLCYEEADLRKSMARNLGLAVALAVVLSLLITRWLLKRLQVFVEAAERVREGDLEFRLDDGGSDEIAAFAGTFNEMVAGLKQSRETLMEQSDRDSLTGLYNHRRFQERLTSEIERARRYHRSFSLLMIDVDHFKSINDTFGHPIGDLALKALADAIREQTRNMDVVARYGGDKFAVIAPEANLKDAKAQAERIRETVEALVLSAAPKPEDAPEKDNRNGIRLTVTIGAASFPDHHKEADGLLMAADIALFRGKHTSRNTVSVYDGAICGHLYLDPQQLYEILRNPDVAAMQSLIAAVDAKDQYTRGHSERVTRYALMLADGLEMSAETRESLKMAGLLHDLGKIGVPYNILSKSDRLTAEEWDAVQRHPSVGGVILQRAPQLDRILPAVLFHHERWDGTGYPDGIPGEQIPLVARILAVADAFDAMTSDRPYRKAMTQQAALDELKANSGKQFDPELVDIFVDAITSETKKAA